MRLLLWSNNSTIQTLGKPLSVSRCFRTAGRKGQGEPHRALSSWFSSQFSLACTSSPESFLWGIGWCPFSLNGWKYFFSFSAWNGILGVYHAHPYRDNLPVKSRIPAFPTGHCFSTSSSLEVRPCSFRPCSHLTHSEVVSILPKLSR